MTEPPPLNVKKALVALTGQIPVNAPPPAWTINIIATYYMILGEAFDAHPLYFFVLALSFFTLSVITLLFYANGIIVHCCRLVRDPHVIKNCHRSIKTHF